jgi:hypothetical protein
MNPKDSKLMSPRKVMACGGSAPGYAKGGVVVGTPLRKTGLADTPLEKAKRQNGVPGMKKGGKC